MQKRLFNLTEEQNGWLREEAQKRGVKDATVLREALDVYRALMARDVNREIIEELESIYPFHNFREIVVKILHDDHMRRTGKNTKEQRSDLAIRIAIRNQFILGAICDKLNLDCPDDGDLMDELTERGYRHQPTNGTN